MENFEKKNRRTTSTTHSNHTLCVPYLCVSRWSALNAQIYSVISHMDVAVEIVVCTCVCVCAMCMRGLWTNGVLGCFTAISRALRRLQLCTPKIYVFMWRDRRS